MTEKIERQPYWRWGIAFYLFLAGTGAGAYMVAVLIDIFRPEMAYLSRSGVFGGTVLVILGIPFLILDLGKKGRFLRAGISIRTAWIGRGFYILSAFIVLGVIQIGLWIWPFSILEGERPLRLTLQIINGVFAFGVAAYTGLLLRSMKSVHFWDTPLIVILFFISALSTGTIFLILSAMPSFGESVREKALLNFLLRADMVLIFLESLILVFYLAAMHDATEASEKSVSALIRGDLKVLFWGGVIVCGIIIPFFLKCIEVFSSEVDLAGLMVISGLFVLLGGLLLRYGVLAAGIQVTPLLPNCR